jgi:hypothetical protein
MRDPKLLWGLTWSMVLRADEEKIVILGNLAVRNMV